MQQRGQELDSFEELVEKAVDAKAKVALRPLCYARRTNQYCFCGSWPSAAKSNTQDSQWKTQRLRNLNSGLRNQKPQFFSAPTALRLLSRLERRKKRKTSNIKTKSLKRALPQPPGAIWLTPLQESLDPKRILVRSSAIIVAKKGTMPTNVLSQQSYKISNGDGNLRIGDWV